MIVNLLQFTSQSSHNSHVCKNTVTQIYVSTWALGNKHDSMERSDARPLQVGTNLLRIKWRSAHFYFLRQICYNYSPVVGHIYHVWRRVSLTRHTCKGRYLKSRLIRVILESYYEHDNDPRISDMMAGSPLFMCSYMDSAFKHQIAVSADQKILVHKHCRFSNNQFIFSTVVFHLWVPRNQNLILPLLRLFVFVKVRAVT